MAAYQLFNDEGASELAMHTECVAPVRRCTVAQCQR